MDILQIQALDVGYSSNTVLRNINLTVKAGEFVSVAAPNGTGKSTLLKTIAGLLPPLNGSILLNGQTVADYSRRELAKQIAVVSSDVAAPDYTAYQMVLMGRFPHVSRFAGLTDQDHFVVRTSMKDVDIWKKQACRCSELSQGERQKVIIARALAQQPKLLLLDEPTAHLDICNQYSILHLIKKLALQKDIAVIAVIHDINLAIQFSTHLLLLKNGRLLSYGRPAEVITAETLNQLYDMDFALYHEAAATYVRPNLF
ncbi:MAG: ABC transporter ATP-binding protein [Veillonellaceae bacterium]|jgi:iron complex transport system ATP-binding protein|nr:ABC transporter ATP-binding protein [Veillonellaceae bacterium]